MNGFLFAIAMKRMCESQKQPDVFEKHVKRKERWELRVI